MTLGTAVSNATQLLKIVPREYELFGGLDVDHHSIVATFADHKKLMQSLRLLYSARQLLKTWASIIRDSGWRLPHVAASGGTKGQDESLGQPRIWPSQIEFGGVSED